MPPEAALHAFGSVARAQPTWITCTDDCRAYRLAGAGPREIARIAAPSLPGIDAGYDSGRNLSWVDGQLWYAHTDLRVYDYATDTLEIRDLQVGRMAFAEGVLWFDARGPGGIVLP